MEIIIIIGLILLNGVLAMSEIAMVSARKNRLETEAKRGNKAAARALKLANEPDRFLSTVQIGITLIGILTGLYSGAAIADDIAGWLERFEPLRPHAEWVAKALVVVVVTYLTLIMGELVPKRIAMQKSLQVAKFSGTVVSGLSVIMRPVIWFLSFSTNCVLRLLRMKTEAEEDNVTEEEIRMMVELGGEKGAIDQEEQEWIQNVFDFGDTSVRDAMTHESDVVAFSIDEKPEVIIQTIQESGLSRKDWGQQDGIPPVAILLPGKIRIEVGPDCPARLMAALLQALKGHA